MSATFFPLINHHLDAVTIDDLNGLIAQAIARGERRILASLNLHSLRLYHQDDRLRAAYELADVVRIDGMSIIALGRLLGLPLQREHRVTFVDWMPSLLDKAANCGWRIFYLGSAPGVVDRGAATIRARYPNVQLATLHGYFDARPGAKANRAVVEAINRWRAHVLLVGMGVPRQEHWIVENHTQLSANVISNCGAALDYVAGAIPTPPRWAGRLGLEWAFRLAAEPRRLASRYLVEPWQLLPLIAKGLLAQRVTSRHPLGKRDRDQGSS